MRAANLIVARKLVFQLRKCERNGKKAELTILYIYYYTQPEDFFKWTRVVTAAGRQPFIYTKKQKAAAHSNIFRKVKRTFAMEIPAELKWRTRPAHFKALFGVLSPRCWLDCENLYTSDLIAIVLLSSGWRARCSLAGGSGFFPRERARWRRRLAVTFSTGRRPRRNCTLRERNQIAKTHTHTIICNWSRRTDILNDYRMCAKMPHLVNEWAPRARRKSRLGQSAHSSFSENGVFSLSLSRAACQTTAFFAVTSVRMRVDSN